ncbi:MAG: ATP-binding cassette domain-containing protein [Burkholderiaceae bacterium]
MLTLAGYEVRFGNVHALRGVDLQIRRGDFVALVGPNGSGKTTLLRALHGLVRGTGTRAVETGGASQAMVFQRPYLLRLSVWHNLLLALWLARAPDTAPLSRVQRRERARAALAECGLTALRDRPARALSGGQQQRLALARAWAVQPALLFLDEPTANLDPSAKNELEAMLARYAAAGMTLVMSTHNLGQAKRLANRVVYIDRGEIHVDLPTPAFFNAHVEGRADLFLKGRLTWDLE